MLDLFIKYCSYCFNFSIEILLTIVSTNFIHLCEINGFISLLYMYCILSYCSFCFIVSFCHKNSKNSSIAMLTNNIGNG